MISIDLYCCYQRQLSAQRRRELGMMADFENDKIFVESREDER
jgi:hypothetical protein